MATTQESGTVLEVRGLTKRFGERTALSDVSFSAAKRELVAVIGPNGAGKTTLLSILSGAIKPSGGSINLHERRTTPPGGSPERAVGWVPQHTALYQKLTVAENLRLFARLERLGEPEEAVERMLDQTGLRDRAHEQVGLLSGGNRQRINIAIGLLAAPVLLLLDEPSTALDPRQRERLWEFVGQLASDGTTVVYSTHYVQEAERHADRVLVLADGELLFWGTPSELERAVGTAGLDFEDAFVHFLRERGH